MIRPAFLFAALTASVLPVVGHASQELAQKNACLACHAMDKNWSALPTPTWRKNTLGKKDAEATLAASIKKGGSGKWGPIPMLPQSALSEADAKTLAKWILSAAK